MKPIVYDLYCGLGGWAEGFLAEGYTVIGFDIVRMAYPGLLVLQDVLTLHGSQLRNGAVIVASPPCTEPSYRAMPWSRAKALNAAGPPVKFIELFEACFRIQREASEAAGRYIPLVAENVKGAQPWVGRAQAHYGSYYLWGDIAQVGNRIVPLRPSFGNFLRAPTGTGGKANPDGTNHPQGSWSKIADSKNRGSQKKSDAVKQHGSGRVWFDKGIAHLPSSSPRRKAASAAIAKIPFPLSQHIARVYKPEAENKGTARP